MNLNPFAEQLIAEETRLSNLNKEITAIKVEIDQFNSIDKNQLEQLIEQLTSDEKTLSNNIRQIDEDISFKKEFMSYHDTFLIGSFFNPFNWFDASQIKHRNYRSELEKSLSLQKGKRSVIAKKLGDLKTKLNEEIIKLEKYNAFNLDVKNSDLSQLAIDVSQAEQKFQNLLKRKNDVDSVLEPFNKQLHEIKSNISNIQTEKNYAEELSKKLNNAENSYKRRITHQECEKNFGHGNPQKVIREKDKILSSLNRNLKKLEERAKSAVQNEVREIHQVIIDGNNFCYEGEVFIGFSALHILIPLLLSKQYRIILVFDASIRKLLQYGDQEIRNSFKEITDVHIVATGKKADETLLDLAGDCKYTFVLSNDRFAEFKDKHVVKESRILRHEIVNGNVFIHDLGISKNYKIA